MNLEKGKAIPQAVDVEQYVLGSLLNDDKSFADIAGVLKSEDMFYKLQHQYIFMAMSDLYRENRAIDLLTVSQKLKEHGKLAKVGGEYELIQLTQKVSSSAHIEHHARILVQYWLKRRIIKKSNLLISQAYKDDTDSLELLENDAKMLDEINDMLAGGQSTITYQQALTDLAKRVEMLSNQEEGEFAGVTTGFKKANKFTGGWQNSDLVIVAARPGMGKTALMLKNVVECGLTGVPLGIFSLEMSIHQLTARTVAINSNFHLSQLIRDGFSKDKYFTTLMERTESMNKFLFMVDDRPALDIREIVTKARMWHRKHGIKILFIDYLQLIKDKTKSNNREQEISSISQQLKGLAKELDIPVIALAQLSRSVETRGGDKRPRLSDLRESGAIEQDADIVTFIYRPAYYDLEVEQEFATQGANAEWSFGKYRAGSLATLGLYFDENKVKYMDPEEFHNENHFIESDNQSLPKLNPKDDEPF